MKGIIIILILLSLNSCSLRQEHSKELQFLADKYMNGSEFATDVIGNYIYRVRIKDGKTYILNKIKVY